MAEELVGRYLFRSSPDGLVAGRIVEVEAYCGADDPASHAYRRMTPRNAVMFGTPGRLYVYFTYGMHHCANIVTDADGVAGAVLLRAVEPTIGLSLMAERRGLDNPHLLAKGPARLCQAFGLTLAQNGTDLVAGEVAVSVSRKLSDPIVASSRIGIAAEHDQPWRFYEDGPWVSRHPRMAQPRSMKATSRAPS